MAAVVPAALAVAVLIFAVKEPRPVDGVRPPRPPIRWIDVLAMGGAFWTVVALGGVFTMARFSEAFLVLRAQDVGLAIMATVPGVLIGVALWGLHMGLTQGLLAALVVDTAPSHMRGTAFGLFNLASSVTLLAASVVAGLLWSRMGPEATFIAGAVFALLATAGLVLLASRRPGGANEAI